MKSIKLPLAILAATCVSVMTTATQAQSLEGTSYAQAKKTSKAEFIFTYTDTPKFSSINPDGSVSGLAVEIMRGFIEYLVQTEGITAYYKFESKDQGKDFSNFLKEVKKGKGGVFGLGNISITEVRKRDYTFSNPFLKGLSVLCTHRDVPTLQGMESSSIAWKDFTPVSISGSTNEEEMIQLCNKYLPGYEIIQKSSDKEVLSTLLSNKKTFTIIDYSVYSAAQQAGLPIKVHPIADKLTEDYGIIMPKNSDWAPLLNRYLSNTYLQSKNYKSVVLTQLGSTGARLLDAFRGSK